MSHTEPRVCNPVPVLSNIASRSQGKGEMDGLPINLETPKQNPEDLSPLASFPSSFKAPLQSQVKTKTQEEIKEGGKTQSPDDNIAEDTETETSASSVNGGGSAGEIRALSWNLESLFDKISLPGVSEFVGTFDVACLSETFTLPNFDFSIKFENFIATHWPAEKFTQLGRPSGGIVVLIKKQLKPFIEIVKTNINHIICLKIKKSLLNSARDLLYICTYIHPSNSIYYSTKSYDSTFEVLEEFIADEIQKNENVDLILTGDLNARIGDWCFSLSDDYTEEECTVFHRTSQDTQMNPNGRRLIEMCNTFNLIPLNGLSSITADNRYTFISRRGNSTIDYFLCTPTYLQHVSGLNVINRVESQHLPVTLCLESNMNRDDEKENQGEFKRFKWQENKTQECINILNKKESERTMEEASAALDSNNINHSINLFTNLMQRIGKPMEHIIQLGKKVVARKPWFDKECSKKKKETLVLLNKMGRLNNKIKPKKYQNAKCKFMTKKLEYQRLIKEKRRSYNQQAKEKLRRECKDSKSFWTTIRQLNHRKTKLPNITTDQWFNHYNNLLNPLEDDSTRPESVGTQEVIEDDYLDQDIQELEVNTAIDSLKTNKASGEDEVTAEILILSKAQIFPFLCKMFRKMFEMGIFPIQWGIAVIVPIYKSGDRDCCGNYRGISLLSVTSKIYTSIINKRLYNWAETNNKINEEQAGFRRNYSTIDHIYTLHAIASNCLYGNKRSKLYAAFIDFQKAFDTVNRNKLWDILEKIGVSTKMLNTLKAIYASVKAVIRVGHEKSTEINCPKGVRQGCLLSPLLFSLLVAEVAYKVAEGGRTGYQLVPGAQEIFALLFADDMVLLSLTPSGLQTQINNLKIAAESLGLIINLNKSKILVYRKGGYLGKQEKWSLGNEPIEVVNGYKYLGYTLTTKLSIETPLSEFAGKAKGKVITIFKTLYKLGKIEPSIFFKLFDAQIKPMMLYAAELWGIASDESIATIEKVHMFACKRLLGVTPRTPNALVQAELNRYPLKIDAQTRAVKYWAKLQRLEDHRLPKQAYLRELNEVNKPNNWAEEIRKILVTNGYAYVWENGGIEFIKSFCRSFKQRLIDQFWQNWHAELYNSDRYEIYRSLKLNHSLETYVESLSISKFRSVYARFRMGITKIRNNERFHHPLSSRKCLVCELDENEDESHFLLKCPLYDDLRQRFLLRCWITLHSLTVIDLIANDNPAVIKNTALFIYYALTLRESCMG